MAVFAFVFLVGRRVDLVCVVRRPPSHRARTVLGIRLRV